MFEYFSRWVASVVRLLPACVEVSIAEVDSDHYCYGKDSLDSENHFASKLRDKTLFFVGIFSLKFLLYLGLD